ncbi:MAG: hypothetical protein U9R01_01550 [candidate division WOR-3 bacterium]|nr:hypothetical protein [candidate division WOR-3 bacterium]
MGTFPYPYGFCERILRYFVFLFEVARLKVRWMRGLKASGLEVGSLLNFNVTAMKDGIK